jgi:hypothetical protein
MSRSMRAQITRHGVSTRLRLPIPICAPQAEGEYFNLDQVMNGIPIELQRRTIRGETIVPVWHLTGYRPTAIDDGRCKAIVPSNTPSRNVRPALCKRSQTVGSHASGFRN